MFCDALPDMNITFRVHMSLLQEFIVVKRVNEYKCKRPSCVVLLLKSRLVNDYGHRVRMLRQRADHRIAAVPDHNFSQ